MKLAVKVRDGSRASRAAESATERCGDSTRIDPPGTVVAVAAETATLSEVTAEIERNRVVSPGTIRLASSVAGTRTAGWLPKDGSSSPSAKVSD